MANTRNINPIIEIHITFSLLDGFSKYNKERARPEATRKEKIELPQINSKIMILSFITYGFKLNICKYNKRDYLMQPLFYLNYPL
jgi:hypothetical protein